MLSQLRSDPNLLRMLNLGEYHSNAKHLNISVELKSVQERFSNFPSAVKTDVSNNVQGTIVVRVRNGVDRRVI